MNVFYINRICVTYFKNLIYPNILTLKYYKLTLKNFFLKKEVICLILNLTLNWTVRV